MVVKMVIVWLLYGIMMVIIQYIIVKICKNMIKYDESHHYPMIEPLLTIINIPLLIILFRSATKLFPENVGLGHDHHDSTSPQHH